MAIGISDCDLIDAEEQLLKFVSHSELRVLDADTPQNLVQYRRWASVVATVGASLGRSKLGGEATGATVALPAPPSDRADFGAAV